MSESWVLIGFIGLLVQIGISGLLWLFFVLLKRHAGRRSRFFRLWTWGWVALLVALVSVSVGFYGPPLPWLRAATLLFYQAAKLVYLLMLLAGVLEYADGRLPQGFLRYGTLVAMLCVVLCLPAAGDQDRAVLVQSVLSILTAAYAAFRLFRLPAARRSLGALVTAISFIFYGLLWCGYALLLYKDSIGLSPALLQALTGFGHFNGYTDSLMELWLACGMVLMLLEDARRETNAAHAELAVAHEKLLHDSLTDPLTGVYNRLAFTRGVFLQSAGATYGSVFIFDLDNLKRVNDSHGHEAGDELLKHFVMTLRGALRPSDQVYRWGGDEFLLLLPGASYASVAPRLASLLYRTPPLLFSERQIPLTLEVSNGGADYSDLESLRAAVNTADRAMYEQKRIHKTAPPPGADLPPAIS
ncbi:MAG TPA: GGDEF domain-containing protein [Gammaproteobacteria bacterium]|nr:GGDEF domain-containing protein [Gammaproteobacteria bacterium]